MPLDLSTLLGGYGLSPAPAYDREPILFGNSGFWGNHSKLAGGIENALITLGNMGEPSPTIGGNISNVARGLMSIGPTRQAHMMNRMAVPFQQAEMAAHLRSLDDEDERKSKLALQAAQTNYYNDRGEAAGNRIYATRPVPTGTGTYIYDPTQKDWVFDDQGKKGGGMGGNTLPERIVGGKGSKDPQVRKFWADVEDTATRMGVNKTTGAHEGNLNTDRANGDLSESDIQSYKAQEGVKKSLQFDSSNPADIVRAKRNGVGYAAIGDHNAMIEKKWAQYTAFLQSADPADYVGFEDWMQFNKAKDGKNAVVPAAKPKPSAAMPEASRGYKPVDPNNPFAQ